MFREFKAREFVNRNKIQTKQTTVNTCYALVIFFVPPTRGAQRVLDMSKIL